MSGKGQKKAAMYIMAAFYTFIFQARYPFPGQGLPVDGVWACAIALWTTVLGCKILSTPILEH